MKIRFLRRLKKIVAGLTVWEMLLATLVPLAIPQLALADAPTPATQVLVAPLGGEYVDYNDLIFEWGVASDSPAHSPVYYKFQISTSSNVNPAPGSSFSGPIVYERKWRSEGEANPLLTTTLNAASESISLSHGTTYYWHVRAEDVTGGSAANRNSWSEVRSFVINNEPDVPTNLTPSSYTNTLTPTFDWTSNDQDGDSLTYILNITGPGLSEEFAVGPDYYTHPGLPSEGTYNWKVKAYDGYEYSEWSTLTSFVVDTTPPFVGSATASPNPFSPNGDGVKDTTTISYTLTEALTVDIAIYDSGNTLVKNLVVDGAGVVGDNTVTWDGTNNSSVVVGDGPYKAEIIAQDAAGNPSNTAVVNITTDRRPPLGTYESSLDTPSPTNDNNPDVSGKYYQPNEAAQGLVQRIAAVVVSGDTAEIEVRYQPSSSNSQGALSASGAPTYYWKQGMMDGNGNYATDDEDGFSYGHAATLGQAKFLISNGTTIPALPDGEYKVSAVAIDLAGNEKAEVIDENLIIDTEKPSTPMNLTVTGKTDESVSLSWDGATDTGSGIGGYKILAGKSSGVYEKTLNVGNVTNCIVIGLSPNTLYYFTVIAYDKAMNESEKSIEVSAKTNDVIANIFGGTAYAASGTEVLGTNTGGTNQGTTGGGETKGEENKDNGNGNTQVLAWYWWLLLLILLGGGIYIGQKYWLKKQS